MVTGLETTAREVAAAVTDPELPMLTLADLGVLRHVETTGSGGAVVTVTPTYSGCPAIAEIRAELHRRLTAAGYEPVEVRTALDPPWSSDWITERGRAKLAEHGISPPGEAPPRGPVTLALAPPSPQLTCPHCGESGAERVSEFGPTACRSLWRCRSCSEPFEHFKEI